MSSIIWALLLIFAQLQTLPCTFTTHADAGNLTRLSAPFLCRPDQAEALLQLKNSFFFDASTTRLLSWRDGTDCCLWEGVGCNTSSGHVMVLDLNNRGLASYGLDPAIFNLTSLRRLDLSMNCFGRNRDTQIWPDNIPTTGFQRFALLTHLNLSNSGFQGQVPNGISKLVNLLSLDISTSVDYSYSFEPYNNYYDNGNYLYESNFDSLVANLSSLRELYLDGVNMSLSGEEWCISLATSVPNLHVLSLADCSLRGPIHESLSRLHSLTVINLQLNFITAGSFPEFFMDFLNLSVLQLSGTNIEGWFPSRPFQSKNLRVLDLSGNQNLSGHVPNFYNASSLDSLRLDGTKFLPAKPVSSSNFKFLKELSLDGNLVSVDFLSSLGRLQSLWQLHLGFGSVTKLGSIFTWIGDHQNLTSMDIDGCDFSMTTSSAIRNFKTLRTLTIYDCNLPGSIMSAIGNLKDLQTLKIFNCETYGSLPSSFGNLKSLINLEITAFLFSESMPAAIGNLSNLKTMEIYCEAISPGGYTSATVPYTIGQLKKLRLLVLNECYFSGKIPNSIANLTQLTKLDLSNNAFHGEIPPFIFTTIPVLRELDLSFNQLSGPIQDFNQALSQLESIVLSNNEFSGPIPKAFFQLTSLTRLDLSSNNLIGLVDLASLWTLKNLDILHLSNNKLFVMDSECNSPLPSDWYGPHVLGLASCNITQFPKSLMCSKYMSYLDLSCNKISGDVPNWLWEIGTGSLTYLNLSHNMLTDMHLTSHVLPLTALNTLDLSYNRFQGRIPMPDSSPEVMDYSNNMFSSVLPNFTLYLWYTAYLSMSNNTLSGHIPYSICTSTLEILDLSHNNFSGPFPSCLIEDGQLVVLNLRENHFVGTLPSYITTECVLQTLDLHGNNFEGRLPRALSNCSYLEVLDVGANLIADSFPSWLRVLPRLSVIVLRSNQFYGTIGDIDGDTKCKVCFPSLQIIDLASNNFSGKLRPQWLKQLTSMMINSNSTGQTIYAYNFSGPLGLYLYEDSIEIMYKGSDIQFQRILTTLTEIDFSNNRLVGAIPESVGKLVSLRLLNLSHNAFMGKIPAQLGGMTDLESLDLSCNQLSGEIPQDLTNLTFLGILNLSNNHLVGKIPQSSQFSTFGSSSFEGNAGLCGPPLSDLPCGAAPYTPGVKNERKSSHHVDVVLFLFVGLGFGIGFAAAIVVKWDQVGRWFSATARASCT